MNIDFDPMTRRSLERLIRKNLPDAAPDDRSLTALALTLWVCQKNEIDLTPYQEQLEKLRRDLKVRQNGEHGLYLPPSQQPAPFRYYEVAARHARKEPRGYIPFVGSLQMVRVTLPQTTPKVFDTAYGSVEPGDHLLATVDECQQEYGPGLDYTIDRLDLVTPARFWGTRFGAISLYLGYRDRTTLPTFYILEGGTATGDARVTYFADDVDDMIYNYTGYKPTPFSNPSNAYSGTLTLQGDSPRRVTVTSRQLAKTRPYMHLTVDFTELAQPAQVLWPAFNIMRAALIVIARQIRGDINDE